MKQRRMQNTITLLGKQHALRPLHVSSNKEAKKKKKKGFKIQAGLTNEPSKQILY